MKPEIVLSFKNKTKNSFTFSKSRPGACVAWWWMNGILVAFGSIYMDWIYRIRIKVGRRTVRPAVQLWVTAVTSDPMLPDKNFIVPAGLLCFVVGALKAPSRVVQMRLDVAAGGAGICRGRVGQKRRTVATESAALWWCCRSRRARTWGWSPWERAHLSPVVRKLMQPGYVGSITP